MLPSNQSDQNLTTEKYIFISEGLDEVCFSFLDKIQSFHKFFIKDLLVSGSYLDLLNLGNFDISSNEEYDGEFLALVFSELVNCKPLVYIRHSNAKWSNNICSIYYLNNKEDTEGFYMTEGFRDLEDPSDSTFRIYKMSESCNLNNINNFWLE